MMMRKGLREMVMILLKEDQVWVHQRKGQEIHLGHFLHQPLDLLLLLLVWLLGEDPLLLLLGSGAWEGEQSGRGGGRWCLRWIGRVLVWGQEKEDKEKDLQDDLIQREELTRPSCFLH